MRIGPRSQPGKLGFRRFFSLSSCKDKEELKLQKRTKGKYYGMVVKTAAQKIKECKPAQPVGDKDGAVKTDYHVFAEPIASMV